MFSVGFEPTISAGERPQIHTLDRAATENLVGLVKENKLIHVHGISNFINVCQPKTPVEFLCTENILTGNLAKFHHSPLDICCSRYVLVTYTAQTMTNRLLRPFTISGWMKIQQCFKDTLCWQIYSVPVSDPSSWHWLDVILWTSSKGSPSYWIWRRSWLHSGTLGYDIWWLYF